MYIIGATCDRLIVRTTRRTLVWTWEMTVQGQLHWQCWKGRSLWIIRPFTHFNPIWHLHLVVPTTIRWPTKEISQLFSAVTRTSIFYPICVTSTRAQELYPDRVEDLIDYESDSSGEVPIKECRRYRQRAEQALRPTQFDWARYDSSRKMTFSYPTHLT